MHADKIRTANLPQFKLEPRDVVVLMCFIGTASYLIGLLVGLGL